MLISKTLKYGSLLLLTAFALLLNCAEDNPAQVSLGTTPELSDLAVPAIIYTGVAQPYSISVRVSDPQGVANIEKVSYTITKSGAAAPLTQGVLFDNGAGGDVIAADGVFSSALSAGFAQGDSGAFVLSTIARDKDANQSDALVAAFSVRNGAANQPPRILEVAAPATVAIDSSSGFVVVITARIADPDGPGDITSVDYAFFEPEQATPTLTGALKDDGADTDQTAGDGLYTASLGSVLFSRLSDYALRIQAMDAAGNTSSPVVRFLRGRPSISVAPTIVTATAPRMVNANAANSVLITAVVSDLEGLADIDTVQFTALLPDNSEAAFSPVQMFDDGDVGNTGDVAAGDGTFSALLPLQPGGAQPLDYRLLFTATDKASLRSQPLLRRFVVGFDDSPYISALFAPGQVTIDPTQAVQILITLDVRDPQGLADVVLAQFRSFRPDGQEAGGSPIELFDDGNNDNGDSLAGDGIFSRFIFLPPQGVMKGDFRFVFEARDAAGHTSNTIEHILTVK